MKAVGVQFGAKTRTFKYGNGERYKRTESKKSNERYRQENEGRKTEIGRYKQKKTRTKKK